jgi:hypothetical protein
MMTEERRGFIIFEDNSVKALDRVSPPMFPFSKLSGEQMRGAINETIKPASVAMSGSRVEVVLRGDEELIVTEKWG